MTSQHTKQLEMNLKQKILIDLKQFFNTGYYTGRGYDKAVQPFLDRIYKEMCNWFYAFEYKEDVETKDNTTKH